MSELTGQAMPPRYPDQPRQQPAPRKKRTGLIVSLVSGGVLLILIIAGIIGFAILSAAHTPQKAVDAYLGALVHGDARHALELGGAKVTSSDLLLTDRAYRAATDHVDRYTLIDSAVNGDGAAVTARITQGTLRYTQSFALVKHGKYLLLFDNWQLKPVTLGRATIDVEAPADATFTVAGVSVTGHSGALRLRALPGTYPVKPASSDADNWYTLTGSSAKVIGFGGAVSQPARLTAQLTDAGMKAATAAVGKHIDGCAASTEFLPSGCSFGASGQTGGATYSDVKWTVDPRPEFTIGRWIAGGWAVTTTKAGSANVTAKYVDDSGGSGTAVAGPVSVRVSGLIAKVDASGATFEPFVAPDQKA